MEYGINVNFFTKTVSLEKAAALAAQAGFTRIDYTPPVHEDDWQFRMKKAAAIFAANSLTVHQTHAPFNRYNRYGDRHALCLERCAEATEYLGAKFMVAHGDEFDFEKQAFNPEAALEYNHNLFAPYVERAAKNGYKVAFETVFEDWDRRRFTSDAQELLALIRSFESESAVCCWDFGHAHVSFGHSAAELVRRFGPLIQCTHLHDNAGIDSHQLPLTGDIDWKAVIGAFKDIGYSGVMSVEYSHGALPEHLTEDFIHLTFRAAEYLWSL